VPAKRAFQIALQALQTQLGARSGFEHALFRACPSCRRRRAAAAGRRDRIRR
jgi:hypothetical protein